MKKGPLSPAETTEVQRHWAGKASFLGEPDAERDAIAAPDWLSALFVRSPAAERAASGASRLVIGRKGSGKSAARIAASKDPANASAPRVLSVGADELVASHAELVGPNMDDGASVAGWHKAFAYTLLKSIAQDLAGSPLADEAKVSLRKWALERGYVARDFGEQVVDLARSCIPKIRKHLPDPADKSKLAEEHVSRLLGGRQLVLFVDDFDNLYNPLSPGSSIRQLRAALEAADRLTASAKGPTVTVLMREDFWVLCRPGWHYLDKVSGAVELHWSEEELESFVRRRLIHAVHMAVGREPSDMTTDQLWAVFFPARILLEDGTSSSGLRYILRRTLYTPRDVQRFLVRIADSTTQWPASQDQVEAAERTYSRDRMEYLANEFSSLCRGLETCLFSFTAKPMEMSATDLYKHLKGLIGSGDVVLGESIREADSQLALAKFLFRIGFLEVRYPDGLRWEVRDALRYPEHWRGIRRDDSIRWAIRSAFYRVLASHGSSKRSPRPKRGRKRT